MSSAELSHTKNALTGRIGLGKQGHMSEADWVMELTRGRCNAGPS
jgi:outer membrane protease